MQYLVDVSRDHPASKDECKLRNRVLLIPAGLVPRTNESPEAAEACALRDVVAFDLDPEVSVVFVDGSDDPDWRDSIGELDEIPCRDPFAVVVFEA
jgi:hypothetical protein